MLADLLADAVSQEIPELDLNHAATLPAAALTIRFRGLAAHWLRHRSELVAMTFDTIIREIIGEVMDNRTQSELQERLRGAASEPIPPFDSDTDDGKTHALTVRLSAKEKHWLDHRSAALNMPASVLIGFLVQQYAKADIASKKGAK